MGIKNSLLAFLTTTSLLLFMAPQARASHAMGADIFYECVGRDSFRITLNFYRDCNGTTAPTSASIGITNTCTGQSSTVTAQRTPLIMPEGIPNGSEVSALCGAQIQNSRCNNNSSSSLPGVQQYQYSYLWVANAECANWRISYDLNARNAQIQTLQNPGGADLYIETFVNNTTHPSLGKICNNSPKFTNRPVPYFCFQDSIFYNHGTIDPDGDSLVYTLVQPLQNPGTVVPYVAGFSISNPLTTNNTFTFNSQTGQMFFVPQQAQVGVIAVRVDEYRNGVLVGSTMRDIQVVVLGPPLCNPPYPQLDVDGIDSSTVSGGVYSGPYDIEACPGDTVRFDIKFQGQNITASSNAGIALPGAVFDTVRLTPDFVLGRFRWVVSATDTGINNFSISYGTNSCPIDRTASQTITITVLNGTDAGLDQVYCTEGQPVQLFATGGSVFTWTPAAGLSNTNIQNPLASPTVTTDYIVQSDLSARCKNRDTVRVSVVPNFVFNIDPVADTVEICRNSLVFLDVDADPASGPYTYSWSPSSGLSGTNIANPVASPLLPTTYVAAVTSSVGCTLRDTIHVRVIGVGAQVLITPEEVTVCPGAPIQLNTEVRPVTCGPSLGTGSCGPGNTPTPRTYGTGATTSSVTPFAGGSTDGRYQVLYRASLLQAQGFTAGTIIRMQLNVGAKASNAVYKNMRIRIGCTDATQLTRQDWLPTTAEVFNSANFLTTAGLNNFTFSQPYDWDGVSNLVIEFCFGDSTFTNAGGNDLLLATTVPYSASMGAVSTTANGGCDLAASSIPLAQPSNQVPNLTFFICTANTPTYTYSWTPTAGLSNPSIPNPTVTTNTPTVYTLTVSDSVCSGQDFVRVNVDTSRINISNDTTLCNADSVRLSVDITGIITNPCGNNGNGCDGPQATTTVGAGTLFNTTTGFPTPYSNNFESARHQYLYRAADLLAAGVNPGRLTSMGFNIRQRQGSSVYRNFTIKIKCTGTTSLTQGNPEGGAFVTVFTPKNISLPNSGWTNHQFDNHFDWDGVSNLIVEICFNNDTDPTQNSNITLNTQVFSSATNYAASTWYPIDNQDACSGALGAPAQMGSSTSRPNVRFTTCNAAPPFTVRWSPANTLTSSTSANPVAFPTTTTVYTATITTINGCTKTDSVRVTVGSLPYTIIPDTTICSGGNVQLVVTGPNNYTYSWTGNTATLSCTNCPNPIATPTANTVYYVTISNGQCVVNDSVVVTVFNLAGNVINDPGTLCVFDSTLITATSGFAGYAWSTGSTGDSTWVYAPGTYTLTVTDASGCSAADTITVTPAAVPPVRLGNDTSICLGESVVLAVDDIYTSYAWNVATTVDTGYTVVATGVYSLTASDANGCQSVDSIAVFVNAVPVVNLGNDTTICSNQTLVLGTTLLPGYTALWQDGSTGATFTVTSTGTYYVTVSGGANCFDSDTINVTVNPAPNVNLGPDVQSCAGQVVILRAGQGFASYLWTPGGSTRDSLVVTVSGTYIVRVEDAIGCSDSDTVQVTFNNPTLSLSNDTICEGESVALDAGSFATYNWSTGESTQTIVVDTTGTYSVTVEDNAGCTASASAFILVLPQPTVTITAGADTICPNALGTILDAGPGYVSYAWSNLGNTQTIPARRAGSYSVTVTNAGGCSASDTFELFEYPLASLVLEDAVLCPGDTLAYTAPAGYATYNWSTGSQTDNTNITATGQYFLTVTNAQGCVAVDSFTVGDGGFTATALVDPTQVDAGQSGNLTVDVLGGSGDYSYSWTPTSYLDNATASNPTTMPDSTITYLVTVTDDSTGCVATDTVTITVFDGARYAFSDAFSPNGDNFNDRFYPMTYGNAQVTTFRIYNRWGELVHDALAPWDGRLEGTEQPMGTYVYYAVIEITSATGKTTETLQGSFTLLR